MIAAKFAVSLNIDRINKSNLRLLDTERISSNSEEYSDTSSSSSEHKCCPEHRDGTKYFSCVHCTGYEGKRRDNKHSRIILANDKNTNVKGCKKTVINGNKKTDVRECKDTDAKRNSTLTTSLKETPRRNKSRNNSQSSDSSGTCSLTSISSLSSSDSLDRKRRREIIREIISSESECTILGGKDTSIYYASPKYLSGPIPHKLPLPPLHWYKQETFDVTKRTPSTVSILDALFNRCSLGSKESSAPSNSTVQTVA